MTDPLLEAVDALIGPVKIRVLQDGLKAVTIIRPSLLDQLGAAVTASAGSPGGAHDSSPASQRNMLDSEALYQYAMMTTQIKDWALIRGIPYSFQSEPGGLLRKWYVAHVAQVEHQDEFYIRQILDWVRLISKKLDPPKKMEITDPCPICRVDKWTGFDGFAYPFPVVIQYWDVGPEGSAPDLTDAEALCRACEHVWEGEDALRKLRWDLNVHTEHAVNEG